jgi:hypothetical protein
MGLLPSQSLEYVTGEVVLAGANSFGEVTAGWI